MMVECWCLVVNPAGARCPVAEISLTNLNQINIRYEGTRGEWLGSE